MAMGQLKIKFVKLGILDSEIEMSQKHFQVSWSRTIGNTQVLRVSQISIKCRIHMIFIIFQWINLLKIHYLLSP